MRGLVAECRERVVNRRVCPVSVHEDGMREACYARCGDRERRLSFDDPLEALRSLSGHGTADLLFLGLDLPKMDGFAVLKYLGGEPRFRSVETVALLDVRDGILIRLKVRLAGARQVVTKPLVRQQIVDLVSNYAWQSASAQASNRLTGSASLQDSEVASCLERE